MVDGRTCSCVHKVMQALRRKEIEGLSSLSISSFDTMKLSYYPNVIDPALGLNVPYLHGPAAGRPERLRGGLLPC